MPSLAYRIEGVPINDAFGKSDGFRRPGTIGFIEPGINMQLRGNLLSFSVAIRQYVNIKDSPTSTRARRRDGAEVHVLRGVLAPAEIRDARSTRRIAVPEIHGIRFRPQMREHLVAGPRAPLVPQR